MRPDPEGRLEPQERTKEFFRVDLKHIREEIEALGEKTVWTMTAAAEEYRQTQAIEKDPPNARNGCDTSSP